MVGAGRILHWLKPYCVHSFVWGLKKTKEVGTFAAPWGFDGEGKRKTCVGDRE